MDTIKENETEAELPPNGNLTVVTRHLSKNYGQFQAVQDVSLEIEPGAIYGFIGPNGAGKTTTMRILATLLEPTAGEAWIGGQQLSRNPDAVKAQIGYM